MSKGRARTDSGVAPHGPWVTSEEHRRAISGEHRRGCRIKAPIADSADHFPPSEALNLSVASNIPVDCAMEPKLLCYSNSDDTPRSPFAPPVRHTCQEVEQKKPPLQLDPRKSLKINSRFGGTPRNPRTPRNPDGRSGWLLGGDRTLAADGAVCPASPFDITIRRNRAHSPPIMPRWRLFLTRSPQHPTA